MSDNWKPIDLVREYGNQTEKVETSEFPNEPIKNFMNSCNLTTCRYNKDGKCTNDESRKECIEVANKVLCIDNTGNKKNSFDICETNPDCEENPYECNHAIKNVLHEYSFICGAGRCKYCK